MDPDTSSPDVTWCESKDNKVVKFDATPLYPECASHENERCEMFCRHCDIPICLTCLASDKHLGHKYSKILDILEEKKNMIKEMQIELKETIGPTYEDIALDVQNGISKIEKEYEDLSRAIEIQGDNLHREIEKVINKSKVKTKEMKTKQLHTLQKHFEDINKKIIEIDDEFDSIDKALDSNNISIILQVLERSKVDQHKKLPSKLVPSGPKFTPGKIQEEKFLKFVGTLSPFNITTEKHGYSINVSPIPSKSTEIYSRNAVSLESPGAGSSPQDSQKLSPGAGSSPQVSKKFPPEAGSSPQVSKKFPAAEYPPADEQQSPDLGSSTL